MESHGTTTKWQHNPRPLSSTAMRAAVMRMYSNAGCPCGAEFLPKRSLILVFFDVAFQFCRHP